jgi:hypothetical protein
MLPTSLPFSLRSKDSWDSSARSQDSRARPVSEKSFAPLGQGDEVRTREEEEKTDCVLREGREKG